MKIKMEEALYDITSITWIFFFYVTLQIQFNENLKVIATG